MQALKIEGRGIQRLRGLITFFCLAGSVAWPGRLCIAKRPAPGRLQPWELVYEGNYAEQYYELLARGDFEEVDVVLTDR